MAKAIDQIRILIDEETPRIKKAMDEANMVAAQAERETFTFPVRFVVKLNPVGEAINVSAEVSYGVRHKVGMDRVEVSNQTELPMGGK